MTNPSESSEEKFDWEKPEEPRQQTAIEIAAEDGVPPPKNTLTAPDRDGNDQPSPPGFGRLVGEMVIRFYEDDGLDVVFPNLGLITVGRLEKSIPFLYNRLHLARQMDARRRAGLPENFVINESDMR